MNFKHLIAATGLGLTLSACAATGGLAGVDTPDNFGEANRQTYAAMIANPEPEYDGEMQGSAEKANAAVDRYRNDEVKEPDTISSTEGPGGGA